MIYQEREHYPSLKDRLQLVREKDLDSTDPDESGYYTSRDVSCYNRLLPYYKGLSFLETLKLKTSRSTSPIDILDVGCGQGVTLAQLIRDFHVQAAGISAIDLRDYAPSQLQEYVRLIDMRQGDIHDLKMIFNEKKIDFVVSIKTFEHLVYPQDVAWQCMDLLKPEGLAFIEYIDKGLVLPGPTI